MLSVATLHIESFIIYIQLSGAVQKRVGCMVFRFLSPFVLERIAIYYISHCTHAPWYSVRIFSFLRISCNVQYTRLLSKQYLHYILQYLNLGAGRCSCITRMVLRSFWLRRYFILNLAKLFLLQSNFCIVESTKNTLEIQTQLYWSSLIVSGYRPELNAMKLIR